MQVEENEIAAAIQRVLATDATNAPAPPAPADAGGESRAVLAPNPRAYRLGWLAASVIVGERYHDSAIDAIPVYHPDHGCDRFLLTRRVSCALLADEASNAFGMIELASPQAPQLTDPDGTVVLPLAELFAADATAALDQLRAHIPPVGLVAGDHAGCPHTRADRYPLLYRAVARLLADEPDVVAGRELVVDDQLIDNSYHPLFIHTAERGSNVTYDWFALQSLATGYAAFVRINGRQSVYRTDRATWATPRELLAHLPEADIRDRLRAWLRLPPASLGPE